MVGLEVETCGYSEVMYLYFVLSCAVMAEQYRMDSLDCLVRALLDQVTVNLEAWPFTLNKRNLRL